MYLQLSQAVDALKLSVCKAQGSRTSQTLGSPAMGTDLIRPSRIRLAIERRSSCSDPGPGPDPDAAPAPPLLTTCSNACVKTLGISSGRLSTDSVTLAIRYQLCFGRCGCVRRELRRAGVMKPERAMMPLKPALAGSSASKKPVNHYICRLSENALRDSSSLHVDSDLRSFHALYPAAAITE